MATAYLSLGSNLGDRAEQLRQAVERLNALPASRVAAVSDVYESEPVGETPEPVPEYLNCAARLETEMGPLALLDATQEIERALGRTPTFRWGPRAIDIDILLYDALALDLERLTIPHPRLRERAFVLVPLREIAPELRLPAGKRVEDALADAAVARQRLVRRGPINRVP